jgi:hypothetical protein
MNQKLLAIIAVVIVAVVVIAAGVYLATQGGNGEVNPSPSATPTPSPTGTATPAPTGTSTPMPTSTSTPSSTVTPTPTSPVGNIADATGLKYSVSVTEGGKTEGYTYQSKNVGSSNVMLRIDYTDENGELTSYILNGAQMKAWTFSDGEWEDISVAYQAQFGVWNGLYEGYVNNLTNWTGGDWSYTVEGVTVRIHDIAVNPSIPDSVFQPN